MKTLPTNSHPLSARAYLAKCENRANRAACARLDFRDACIRFAWISLAAIALCVVAGGLIHSAIILSH